MATSNPTLYSQIYAPWVQSLNNFSKILKTAEKFADENGKKHEDMINFRLVEDMRGLAFQVQSVCNTVKFTLLRLGLMEDIKVEDNETTFAEFQQRIATALGFLEKYGSKPEPWTGKDKEPVIMRTVGGTFNMDNGQTYVSFFAIPNFHFHLSTAYCILRHLGVRIDAMDYFGAEVFSNKVEE